MRDATIGNTITQTATTSAVEILGPSPRRKAFVLSPLAVGVTGVISLSNRPDVVAGQGVLNYYVGLPMPTAIDDSLLGDWIHMPWYIISGNGGEVVQILEVLYAQDQD